MTEIVVDIISSVVLLIEINIADKHITGSCVEQNAMLICL